MWIIKSAPLMVLFVGLCSAAVTTQNKAKTEIKEKRDVPVGGSAPYSYDVPQKQFHAPSHHQPQPNSHQPQPKYTNIESHQAIQKVAPLEYTHAKQEISVAPIQSQKVEHQQPQQQHQQQQQQQQYTSYHPTTFHQSVQYAPETESTLTQAYKAYEDFPITYPNYESFSQMPIVHYNGDYDKFTSSIVTIPGYDVKAAPVHSNLKAYPSFTYAAPYTTHAAPSSSHVIPYSSHYYSAPQSYSSAPQSYSSAPQSYSSASQSYSSAPQSYSSVPYSYSNSYAPATNFQHNFGYSSPVSAAIYAAPQTTEIKTSKMPIYASGTKGLSHYSSLAVAPIAAHPSNPYVKNTYDATSYTQTERPFRPSALLGASHVDSYTQAVKPANVVEYVAPSKNYLPAKEHATYPAQVEYQIQYVQQQQPTKAYVAPVANSYLPPKLISQEAPKSTYLPPVTPQPHAPAKNYLPAKIEKPASTYLPTKTYLPPSAPYQNQQYQQMGASVHNQYKQETYETVEYQTGGSHPGHK